MTDCSLSKIEFPRCCGRRVEADFGGGDISSNGGALLVAAADRRVGLLSGLARRLDDGRQRGKITHQLLPLLRQRVYAVALGHEDVNDHGGLRDDLALQTALGRDTRLASPSTVGRLDRAADRAWAWAAHMSVHLALPGHSEERCSRALTPSHAPPPSATPPLLWSFPA